MLKDTHPLTRAAVALSFADPATPRQRGVEGDRHGEREERRPLERSRAIVPSLAAPEGGAEETKTGDWPGLGQVAWVVRAVEAVSGERAGETTREEADALVRWVGGPAPPAQVLAAWRGQWPIEHGRHARRDVTGGEDACQVRSGAAPANLAAVRNTVLGLVEPLLHQNRFPNLPAAQRRLALYPAEALTLLGITAPSLE